MIRTNKNNIAIFDILNKVYEASGHINMQKGGVRVQSMTEANHLVLTKSTMLIYIVALPN